MKVAGNDVGTSITTVLAILGSTISPYLFFWQASEEVEEEINMDRNSLSKLGRHLSGVERYNSGTDVILTVSRC
jgi:Mn2+/Fe2+ NRAMP family transporter